MFTSHHLTQARIWARQEGFTLVRDDKLRQFRSSMQVDPFAARTLADPAKVSDYMARRQAAEITAQLRAEGAFFVGEITDPDNRLKRVETSLMVMLPGAFD